MGKGVAAVLILIVLAMVVIGIFIKWVEADGGEM